MNNLLELIKSRRSIRQYKEKDLIKTDIDKLLEAIRWAPSWTNSQCWEVIIVENKDLRKKLQDTLPPKGNPAKKSITQASILLILCAKKKISGFYNRKMATKFGDWFMYDLGLATQNLCLLAHSMGLGTVVVGLFDHKAAKKIIDLPDKYEIVTMIPIGFPLKETTAPKRKKIIDFTHINHFKN